MFGYQTIGIADVDYTCKEENGCASAICKCKGNKCYTLHCGCQCDGFSSECDCSVS